jgi:hypothetical protein
VSLGGLGISRYAGLTSKKACLLSREMAYNFMEQHYPDLANTAARVWQPVALEFRDDSLWGEIDASTQQREMQSVNLMLASGEDELPALVNGDGHQLRTTVRSAIRRRVAERSDEDREEGINAKSIVRRIEDCRVAGLSKYLSNKGLHAQSLWLQSSAFPSSGKWLQGPIGQFRSGRSLFKNPEEYRMALSMRLLLSPLASLDVDVDRVILCSCGNRFSAKMDPLHHLDCACQQHGFIARHNAVRDCLFSFLEERKSATTSVVIEPSFDDNDGPAENYVGDIAEWRERRRRGPVRADVALYTWNNRQYFDVAVVNPAAQSYRIAPRVPTMDDDLAGDEVFAQHELVKSMAVQHREEAKRAKYRVVMGEAADDPAKFVPFVVQACGGLGGAATAAVLKLMGTGNITWAKKSIFTKINAIVARYNAMMAVTWVDLLRKHQPHLFRRL